MLCFSEIDRESQNPSKRMKTEDIPSQEFRNTYPSENFHSAYPFSMKWLSDRALDEFNLLLEMDSDYILFQGPKSGHSHMHQPRYIRMCYSHLSEEVSMPPWFS